MPQAKRGTNKYLERYAEPEAELADRLVTSYGHAVVVPAYGEGEKLVEALRSIPKGPAGPVLVVLIVNAKAAAPPWMHERNRAVAARLRSAFGSANESEISGSPPARLFEFSARHVLIVDRSEPPHWFPDGQGVGLARKIGVDLCVRLYQQKRLVSRFVHTTDADVELPGDYLERPELADSQARSAALVYSFSHRPEPDRDCAMAIALYEISLRYYVLGLCFAGSPFAYHTIGSTLAVDVDAYAAVRGFPRRDAAEDFYLLAKIAKVGRVTSLAGRPIMIRGRPSNRVPFGTGRAVQRIAAEGTGRFTLYDPTLFRYLAAWLRAMTAFSEERVDCDPVRFVDAACADDQLEPRRLVDALEELDAFAALALARRHAKDQPSLERRLHTWFDSFRTLKLVHALERRGLDRRPWIEALREAPWACAALSTEDGSLDEQPVALARIAQRLARMELNGRRQ